MTHALPPVEDVTRANPAEASGPTGPLGGQFALGGGRVTAAGQRQKGKPGGHHSPAKPATAHHAPAAPAGPRKFSYNAKTNQGVGYGVKGGDPNVRILQSDLNRLGLTDGAGKPLAVDGRYGPRTTAAVKKLQKSLGLAQTGQVDENLIKQVSAMKSLPTPKIPAKPKGVPVHRSMTKPYGDVAYADPGYQDDKKQRYPIDTVEHAKAAWSYVNQGDNASMYDPRSLAKVKMRIQAALKKFGVDEPDSAGPDEPDSTRSRILAKLGLITRSGPMTYERVFALDDIQISRSGDGRTVEAYAATFDTPYEVRDQHGHYNEVINRAAFNRTLKGAGKDAVCVYNHGMTLHGTPDGMASLPLGKPLEIRPDGRGLLTVTRYNKGPWADSVLESIRNGDIKAQSFRGGIYRSDPMGKVPRRRNLTDPLPTVTRHELGLTDYGPTPTAVNNDSAIVAVRSAADIIDAIGYLDADERDELLRALHLTDTPFGHAEEDPSNGDPDLLAEIEQEDLDQHVEDEQEATSDEEPGAETPAEDPPTGALRSAADIARRIRAELIRRSGT